MGSVKMKVHLTGMPELRLGLNDKVLFESTYISCILWRVKFAWGNLCGSILSFVLQRSIVKPSLIPRLSVQLFFRKKAGQRAWERG